MKISFLSILLLAFSFQKGALAVTCKDSQALPDKNGICYCNYSYFGTPNGVNTQCTPCGGNESSPYGSISSLACITCPTDTSHFDSGTGQCLCEDPNAVFNYTPQVCVCLANYYGDATNNNPCVPCPNGQTSQQGSQQSCQGSYSNILIAAQFLVYFLMILL
ncbi:hypothetical protein ABPG74_011141 [Tetrahymena malaccensis]